MTGTNGPLLNHLERAIAEIEESMKGSGHIPLRVTQLNAFSEALAEFVRLARDGKMTPEQGLEVLETWSSLLGRSGGSFFSFGVIMGVVKQSSPPKQ
jgi:hypothetical protein